MKAGGCERRGPQSQVAQALQGTGMAPVVDTAQGTLSDPSPSRGSGR